MTQARQGVDSWTSDVHIWAFDPQRTFIDMPIDPAFCTDPDAPSLCTILGLQARILRNPKATEARRRALAS